MEDTNLIYITVSNIDEARKIARILVEEKLVACANIINNVTSIYWWEEKLQEDQEVSIIAKTVKKLVDTVIKRVKQTHSYQCPCVVSVKIDDGNKDFLKWVASSVKLHY